MIDIFLYFTHNALRNLSSSETMPNLLSIWQFSVNNAKFAKWPLLSACCYDVADFKKSESPRDEISFSRMKRTFPSRPFSFHLR